MDYSKLKKILIILIIISLFLNICNKVFGSYDITTINNATYNLPDSFEQYNYYIVFKSGSRYYAYASNSLFYIQSNNSDYRLGFKVSSSYLECYSSTTDFSSSTVNNLNAARLYNNLYGIGGYAKSSFSVYLCNFDLKYVSDDSVFFESNISIGLEPPEITTTQEDLELLNFEYVQINANDYSQARFYLDVFDLNGFTNEQIELYQYATGRKNRILLTSDSSYYNQDLSTSENIVYWIPKKDLGLTWKEQGKYRFEFVSSTIEGEGENELEYLEIMGEPVTFTLSSGVALSQIEQANQERLIENQKGQTDAINEQKEQDKQFYDNLMSNDYDESQLDGLAGSTGGAGDVDDSDYTGLFSAIFGKLSNIINGNFSSVEEIEYPLPNTDGKIVLKSDLLSSKIQGTFIYIFLQTFWLFLFGMYIFKFSNNLIRKIKDGSILNGYENNNEVISSTML